MLKTAAGSGSPPNGADAAWTAHGVPPLGVVGDDEAVECDRHLLEGAPQRDEHGRHGGAVVVGGGCESPPPPPPRPAPMSRARTITSGTAHASSSQRVRFTAPLR
jgi:hypothetical protein